MRLAEVHIDNYRSFSKFNVGFENFTVAIGCNNAGKTSLAHALELVFHSGSDRSIPVNREDFREEGKTIVIHAVFDDLDEKDTQAFFSLRDGTPGPEKMGVLLEAVWEEGEIQCNRFLTRPERNPEDQRVGSYTRRYSQFIHYSYISPYREVETSSRFVRGSDYRQIVTRYAGDYLQPVGSLVATIRSTRQALDEEIAQRGGFDTHERRSFYEQLDLILEYHRNSPLADPAIGVPDKYADILDQLATKWSDRTEALLAALETAVADGDSSITREIYRDYEGLSTKVANLIQRCRVQLVLISLRDSVTQNQEFAMMQTGLSEVLGLLLPETSSDVEPFPVQDDRLFSEALIRLGDTDLLQCGSGLQSTFAIGLRIVRILSDVAASTPPRLLMFAIEEPEAHLHPHKQRHVVKAFRQLQNHLLDVKNLETQFLITTHSSNILSGLSYEELVMLRLHNGRTMPVKLDGTAFLETWLDQMNVHGSTHRTRMKKLIKRWLQDFMHQYGEVLFARFTLFLEGHSERGAFPVWANLLPEPNDLDQLGISVLVADGSQLAHAAPLLKGLGIQFLLVCDSADGHDLSGYDPSDYTVTDEAYFEDEILAVMPLSKVLRAVGFSLNDAERDGLRKTMASRVGVPAFADAETWEELVAITQSGRMSADDVDRLRSILKEEKVSASNQRQLMKGADIGALLAEEATSEDEVPPVYLKALKTGVAKARKLLQHG